MTYRADIDGLRAIAVLSIILFHLGVTEMSGGYVGVDVFFVISGYLITSLLLKDMENNTFAFRTFFARRIRRLGPALLVTLLATLVAGLVLLSPVHLELLAESAIAALLSISNILFWTEAGYFDEDAIFKPLLHTWSLGVEEQFYLVWPVIMLWSLRHGRKRAAIVLATLSAGSLIWSETLLRSAPDTVFFLAPFRLFEFAFGAGLALWRPNSKDGSLVASLMSLLGLLLILYAVFIFTETTRFPGIYALVPCLGAALLIWAGPGACANRVLSLAPMVFIGRISYSLYLVHWPVVVYYAYVNGSPESLPEVLGLTILVFALAFGLYASVEQTFRRRRSSDPSAQFQVPGKVFAVGMSAAAIAVFSFSLLIDQRDGLPSRLPEEMAALQDAIEVGRNRRNQLTRRGTCFISETMSMSEHLAVLDNCAPPEMDNLIVIFGDSHAADIYVAMHRALPDRNIMQITMASCAYGRGPNSMVRCKNFFDAASNWIKQHSDSIDILVYSQRGGRLLDGDPAEAGKTLNVRDSAPFDIRQELERLDTGSAEVVFWGPRPEFHPQLRVALSLSLSVEQLRKHYTAETMAIYAELDEALEREFRSSPVIYLSSKDVICDPECDFLRPDGQPIIFDYGHWTPEGGDEVLGRMLQNYSILAATLRDL